MHPESNELDIMYPSPGSTACLDLTSLDSLPQIAGRMTGKQGVSQANGWQVMRVTTTAPWYIQVSGCLCCHTIVLGEP